jgi:uncharacterized membrane protein
MRRHEDEPTGTRPRTERGLDRLVNFTDATVAIAITVLVLPLVDIAADLHDTPLRDLVHDNQGAILSFAVTFLVIARLWMTHHRILESVADYDDALIWWCFGWLFSIVTLPFSANVLSGADQVDDAGIVGLYIGTILAATVTLVGTEVHLARRPALLRSDAPVLDPTGGYVMVALVAVAMALGVFTRLGLLALLLLTLGGPVEAALRRARRARAPA